MRKKILTILLLTALILSSGCASQGDGEPKDTTPVQSEAETEAETQSAAYIISQKYADKDYGGEEIHILAPAPGTHFYHFTGPEENELWYEEQTGSVLNDAIYDRNRMTEELLNITIVPEFSQDVTLATKSSVLAQDDSFSTVLNRLDYTANLAVDGYLDNLCKIDSMNVENEWWDKDIVSNFTLFNSKLYLISGDINYYDDYAVQAIFFNEKILEDEGSGYNLYQLVRDGKWTFDILKELSISVTRDINGDGVMSTSNDQYGYGDNPSVILHHLYPLGEKMSGTDKDGNLQLTLMSDSMVSAVDTLYSFFAESGAVYYNGYEGSTMFKQGRMLMFTDMIGIISTFRDMENDFGVLPMPKKDESMDRYSAYVSNGWSTAYSIPKSSLDSEKTGVILETMSAFSVDTVTNALYNVMLESKLVRSTDSREMLSYIFDSKVFDWAGDLAWASSVRGIFDNLVNQKSNSYVSSVEKITKGATKSLEKMLELYYELD